MAQQWIMPIYNEHKPKGSLIAGILLVIMLVTMAFFYFIPNEQKIETTTKWDGPPEQYMVYTQTSNKGYNTVQYETNLTVPKTSHSAAPSEKDLGKEGVGWLT